VPDDEATRELATCLDREDPRDEVPGGVAGQHDGAVLELTSNADGVE
jgi:hypothetical protein